jgi:hypothetical protein
MDKRIFCGRKLPSGLLDPALSGLQDENNAEKKKVIVEYKNKC